MDRSLLTYSKNAVLGFMRSVRAELGRCASCGFSEFWSFWEMFVGQVAETESTRKLLPGCAGREFDMDKATGCKRTPGTAGLLVHLLCFVWLPVVIEYVVQSGFLHGLVLSHSLSPPHHHAAATITLET